MASHSPDYFFVTGPSRRGAVRVFPQTRPEDSPNGKAHRGSAAVEEIRVAIVRRLRARLPEIEQVIFAQLRSIAPDPVEIGNAEYTSGLSAAVTAGVDYSLLAIEHGGEWSGPIPPGIIEQAHRAARSGVSVETVMRRVSVAERLVKKFATDEADHLPAQVLDKVLSSLGAAIDRLMAALADEYNQERERMERTPEQRRMEIVQRLLANEPVDSVDLAKLGYELHASWHVGLIATGAGAEQTLRHLKASLGCQLLAVPSGVGSVWAWLGGRRKLAVTDIERSLSTNGVVSVSLAIGGPGQGIAGWGQTYREAQGALLRALRQPETLVRYADRPLLVAALQNETLATWLKEFLVPLRSQTDGGTRLLQALRAYIDAECNYRAAGCVLDHDRHTVESRVRKAEKLLGRSLRTCLPELDAALSLEELNGHTTR
jgi:PucR C-terminal helix-turn-helix domain/GGDEF-like domain